MTNDEQRQATIIELVTRARNLNAKEKQFENLKPAIAVLIEQVGTDAVNLMGLTMALIEWAALVAYGTVEQPCDLSIRTGEDIGSLAAGLWDDVCRNHEQVMAQMRKQGQPIPTQLQKAVEAAPSDATKRPDVLPTHNPIANTSEPASLDDILNMITAEGSGAEN